MAVIEGSSSKRVGRNHFASYPLDMDEVKRFVFLRDSAVFATKTVDKQPTLCYIYMVRHK